MCETCDRTARDEARRTMLAEVAEHDYTVVRVAPEWAGRGWSPGFSYSVGLWAFRQVPEVVVVGAAPCCASAMIDWYAVGAEHPDATQALHPGSLHHGLVPDRPVVFEQVNPAFYEEWLAGAFHLYPYGDFLALQLVWPDRRGCWPWEPGWQLNEQPQPLLTWSGHPDSFDPGMVVDSTRVERAMAEVAR